MTTPTLTKKQTQVLDKAVEAYKAALATGTDRKKALDLFVDTMQEKADLALDVVQELMKTLPALKTGKKTLRVKTTEPLTCEEVAQGHKNPAPTSEPATPTSEPINPAPEPVAPQVPHPAPVDDRAARITKAEKAELKALRMYDTTDLTPDMAARLVTLQTKYPAPTSEPKQRSTVESPCQVVFELARTMPGASRKDVVNAAIARGVNPFTARTQYQVWYKANHPNTTPDNA